MTNLEYLSEFLTKNYGAICFHNSMEDGYVVFDKNSEKSMETLSVYFANQIDLYNPAVKERLEKCCGKYFYKRYIGANNVKLSPLAGSFLATRYELNGVTLSIKYRMPDFHLGGGIWEIIKYFMGNRIDGEKLEYPKISCPIISNTGFIINEGDNIKTALEHYLTENNYPLVNRANGFYVASSLSDESTDIFGMQILKANEIWKERGEAFKASLAFMTESDWDVYKRISGIYKHIEKAETYRKNNEWDD